jgi:hypothetical protein
MGRAGRKEKREKEKSISKELDLYQSSPKSRLRGKFV